MNRKLLSSAVLAVAAVASFGASAETFNNYLFDQMKAPVTRTRAEVKAEAAQAPRDTAANTLGATGQQNVTPVRADSTAQAPQASNLVKTSQQQ